MLPFSSKPILREKHLTQEDIGKLTLEDWNKLQKKPIQPLSQKDRPWESKHCTWVKVSRKRGQKKLLPYREAKILGTRDHKHQGHWPHHSPVSPACMPATMRTTAAAHAPFAAHPPPVTPAPLPLSHLLPCGTCSITTTPQPNTPARL
jgi:hypothetical protein